MKKVYIYDHVNPSVSNVSWSQQLVFRSLAIYQSEIFYRDQFIDSDDDVTFSIKRH